MSTLRHLWLLSLIGLALCLAGCGGGGGAPAPTGGVKLTLGADTLAQAKAITPLAALDDGARVLATDFLTGATVATGTLTGGACTLAGVTPGRTVAVVITGTRGGKQYRLSLIVPNVPAADAEYRVDPVSSLAAEAIAGKLPATALDDATYQAVYDAAETVVSNAGPAADYSLTAGGIIAGTALGAVKTDAVNTLDAVVPATVDSGVAQAKNAVAQAKLAVGQYEPALASEAARVEDAYGEVGGALTTLSDRLGKLIDLDHADLIPHQLRREPPHHHPGVRHADAPRDQERLPARDGLGYERTGGVRVSEAVAPSPPCQPLPPAPSPTR